VKLLSIVRVLTALVVVYYQQSNVSLLVKIPLVVVLTTSKT
jgi:hypothetical protein